MKWTEAPDAVRDVVATHLGPVTAVDDIIAGSRADLTTIVTTPTRRAFVKGVRDVDFRMRLLRNEILIGAAALTDLVPAVLAHVDLDDEDGTPAEPDDPRRLRWTRQPPSRARRLRPRTRARFGRYSSAPVSSQRQSNAADTVSDGRSGPATAHAPRCGCGHHFMIARQARNLAITGRPPRIGAGEGFAAMSFARPAVPGTYPDRSAHHEVLSARGLGGCADSRG